MSTIKDNEYRKLTENFQNYMEGKPSTNKLDEGFIQNVGNKIKSMVSVAKEKAIKKSSAVAIKAAAAIPARYGPFAIADDEDFIRFDEKFEEYGPIELRYEDKKVQYNTSMLDSFAYNEIKDILYFNSDEYEYEDLAFNMTTMEVYSVNPYTFQRLD